MSDDNFQEKRKYVRLKGTLPVSFQVIGREGQVIPGIRCESGETNNVSKDGLCLESHCIDENTLNYLSREKMLMEVFVEHDAKEKIRCVCEVIWFQRADEMSEGKYLVGLKFKTIAKDDLKTLLSKAENQTKAFTITALTIFFLLAILLYILFAAI